MALSGYINTNGYSGRYLKLEWSAAQNIETNTSIISWSIKGAGKASATYYYARKIKAIINGQTVYTQSGNAIQLKENTVVASGTLDIKHNGDGKKSFSASIEGAIYDYGVNCQGSGTFTLNQIPRAATLTRCPDFSDGASYISINYTNPAGTGVPSGGLQAGIFFKREGGDADTLIPYETVDREGSYHKFYITENIKLKIQQKFPNANSGTVYFYLRTQYNNKTYYSSMEKTVSINEAPPAISVTLNDSEDAIVNNITHDNQIVVGNISNMQYSITAATHKYATWKSSHAEQSGHIYDTANGTWYNDDVESGIFNFSVTDSRGLKTSLTKELTFIPYFAPSITASAKTNLDTTTTAKSEIKLSGYGFNGNFNPTRTDTNNNVTLGYAIKEDSYGVDYPKDKDGNIIFTNVNATFNKNQYNADFLINGLDYEKQFKVLVCVKDNIYGNIYSNYPTQELTISAKPIFDFGKDSFNFNVDLFLRGQPMAIATLEDVGNGWTALKYSNGLAIAWRTVSFSAVLSHSYGNAFYENYNVAAPNFFTEYYKVDLVPQAMSGLVQATYRKIENNTIYYHLFSPNKDTYTVDLQMEIVGKWK